MSGIGFLAKNLLKEFVQVRDTNPFKQSNFSLDCEKMKLSLLSSKVIKFPQQLTLEIFCDDDRLGGRLKIIQQPHNSTAGAAAYLLQNMKFFARKIHIFWSLVLQSLCSHILSCNLPKNYSFHLNIYGGLPCSASDKPFQRNHLQYFEACYILL